jgi:hypothetical protein
MNLIKRKQAGFFCISSILNIVLFLIPGNLNRINASGMLFKYVRNEFSDCFADGIKYGKLTPYMIEVVHVYISIMINP